MKEVALNSNTSAKACLLSMLLAIIGGMLLVWDEKALFLFLGSFIALAMLIYLLNNPIQAIVIFICTKCLVDMLWFIKFPISGVELNLPRITGVLLPIASLLILIIFSKYKKLPRIDFGILAPLIIVFVLMNLLSIFTSPNKVLAAGDFFRVVGPFVFIFFGALYLTDLKKINKFVKYFLVFLTLAIASALLQQMDTISSETLMGKVLHSTTAIGGGDSLNRLTGLYFDPLSLTRYFLIGLPFLLLKITSPDTKNGKFLYFVLFLGVVYVIFFSFYRAMWIVFFIQLIGWFILQRKWKIVALITIGGIIGIKTILASDMLSSFWTPLTQLFNFSENTFTSALGGRIGLWGIQLHHFSNSSWIERLFGNGLASTISISEKYIPFHSSRGTYASHNDFIRVLMENGLIGLGAYVSILLIFFKKLIQTIKYESNRKLTAFYKMYFVIYIGFLILSLTSRPSAYPGITWCLWFLSGGILYHLYCLKNDIKSETIRKKDGFGKINKEED